MAGTRAERTEEMGEKKTPLHSNSRETAKKKTRKSIPTSIPEKPGTMSQAIPAEKKRGKSRYQVANQVSH